MQGAELAGTFVFAVSGVLAVAQQRFDWFGGLVVGVVTALGGGTMRDVMLGEAPVFWVTDQTFLLFALAGAVAAIPLARLLAGRSLKAFDESIQFADAAGLALFSVVGANIALDLGYDAAIAIVAGIVSGVGGGVVRDVLARRTPLIMQGEIYATAALAGAGTFVGLVELTSAPDRVIGAAAMLIVFGLRVLGIRRQWRLPTVGASEP